MSATNPTLGGAVCIRNGDLLDFPWRQCVQSLLPVCDEVVLCVGSRSTDNTEEDAREWASREGKIKLCIWDWPDPKGDPDFWVKWLNYAREHITCDYHLQLDADEILHEDSYDEVRRFIQFTPGRSAVFTRYNFWKDHKHTIPDGHCLGKYVIRLAPAHVWLASDGCHPMGNEAVSISTRTSAQIFHYGFIRKRDAFFKKERLLQNYFFNSYDPRLESAEKEHGNWMQAYGMPDWVHQLDEYHGTHPAVIKPWLKERGYE